MRTNQTDAFSLKANFLYNSIFQLVNILVPLITTPYVSRILLPEGIGIYSYAYSVAFYFVTFGILGLSNYGNRTIAKVRDNPELCSRTFFEIYGMQLLTTLTVNVAYVIYLLWVNDKMAWLLLPYVLSSVFDINWFLFGLELFKLTTIRNILVKCLTTILIFVFVKDFNDLQYYGLIMSGSFLLSQLILWPSAIKRLRYITPSLESIIKHFKPNLILFVPVIAISLYKMMDKIMLGNLIDKVAVGYYESSEKLMQIPLALIVSLGTVMLPRISNLVAKGDDNQANRYLPISIAVSVFLSTATCFGIMSVSKEFVPLFFGTGYDPCILLLIILLPSCIFIGVASVLRTQILIPYELDIIYIKSVIIGAGINLIFNIILIPTFKYNGAAIATVLAEFFVFAYQLVSVRNRLELKNISLVALPFILSGIIMFIILYNISFPYALFFSIVIKVLAGIGIYCISFVGIVGGLYLFHIKYLDLVRIKQ